MQKSYDIDDVAKESSEWARSRRVYVFLNGGKMVILHPQELLLTYLDDSKLSVLRAADRNINNLFVGFVKQVNR